MEMLDVSADEIMRMVDEVFERRSKVSGYEVRSLGRLYALGPDGERALRYLADGEYDKESLKCALVEALIEASVHRAEFDDIELAWWRPTA